MSAESIRGILLPILLGALVLELLWSWRRGQRIFHLGESLANLGILVGNNLLKPVTLAWQYLIFELVQPFRCWTLPDAIWAYGLTFLAAELAYYWYHRLSHEIPLLWTIHHTHHSSQWMNLTTAVRLNWLGSFISPLFFLPLILLGFDPLLLALSLGLGLFYQFFLHTELVGKLGPFEGLLLNTPSAHRVHHGSNEAYIDTNYGAVLIIWDRLFGTYSAETEAVRYGVTTGAVGNNPVKIVFGPLLQFVRGEWKREKAVLAERRQEGTSKTRTG